jgi:serine/threonine protein phosphatase 1
MTRKKGTRWAIGDVHGCIKTLKTLIKKLEYVPSRDSLYFTGDYVDRGPGSKEVIDYIWKLQAESKHVYPLKGNHEVIVLDVADNPAYEKHWSTHNGGQATLESFGVDQARSIPHKYLQWMTDLPLWAKTPGYILSHAGLNLAHPQPFRQTDTNIEHVLWNRDSGGYDPAGQIVMIVGHTPKSTSEIITRLVQAKPKLYIDGGCAYGHNLVAFNMEERAFVFQKLVDIVQ